MAAIIGPLPTVAAGVIIDGGQCGAVTINGSGAGAVVDGLTLNGNNILRNLVITNFTGRQLVINGRNNRLGPCVVVRK